MTLTLASGQKHVIHPLHGISDAAGAAHIPDVILNPLVPVELAHVILFFFIPGKDADFGERVGFQESAQDGVAKGAGPAGDEEGFVVHIKSLFQTSILIYL